MSVRWTTPQGTSRTGEIAGRADAAPGSLTAVWIDKAGQLTARPLSRTDVLERVIEAVAVTATALILLLSAISWAASLVLDRHRLARWEAEWLVLSYREVVTVYTRAGGSYVVARENFGPRVAQVAAVALMVDYVVTVAVQTAAGSAAILSTFLALAPAAG